MAAEPVQIKRTRPCCCFLVTYLTVAGLCAGYTHHDTSQYDTDYDTNVDRLTVDHHSPVHKRYTPHLFQGLPAIFPVKSPSHSYDDKRTIDVPSGQRAKQQGASSIRTRDSLLPPAARENRHSLSPWPYSGNHNGLRASSLENQEVVQGRVTGRPRRGTTVLSAAQGRVDNQATPSGSQNGNTWDLLPHVARAASTKANPGPQRYPPDGSSEANDHADVLIYHQKSDYQKDLKVPHTRHEIIKTGSELDNTSFMIGGKLIRHRRQLSEVRVEGSDSGSSANGSDAFVHPPSPKVSNISESSLSYRAKGYVDGSRTRTLDTSSVIELRGKDDTQGAMSPSQDHTSEPPQPEEPTSEPVSEPPSSTTTRFSEIYLLGVQPGSLGAEPEGGLGNSSVEPSAEAESEPEPWPEGEGEPHNDTDTPSYMEGCEDKLCYAEPYPDWTVAKPLYGGAWEFHVYGFGIAFAILAIYSFASMIVLRRKVNLLSKGYFMSLNFMLLLLGVTRAIYLLVDGYDSQGLFHPIVSYMLINISFPCLTSAFSILFLAMLRATKMQIISTRIQKVKILICIIIFHFVLSFTVDIIVGMLYNLRVLFLVCQITFILWGSAVFCGYFYLFIKLYRSPTMGASVRESYHPNRSISGIAPVGRDSEHKNRFSKLKSFHLKVMLNLALKVTLSTAILGVAYIIVVIYGMADVFNVFAISSPEPWPFWAYHFCIRLIELAMCGTMSFVATQPLRYKNKAGQVPGKGSSAGTDCGLLCLLPCYRFCVDVESDRDVSSSADKCIAGDGVLSHTESEGKVEELNVSVV